MTNFKAVAQWTGVDGFDFDCEEDVRASTIATMVAALAPVSTGGVITLCPYDRMSWWISCLEEVYRAHGNQVVRRLNLQDYGGAVPRDWIAGLAAAKNRTGVREPAAFLSAGEFVAPPSELCPVFADHARAGLRAGYLWQYGTFAAPTRAYAQALFNGLSGRPCP
ncbi:hypothetical protein ACFYNO_23515 [Kitasatospora sp. NPDC006697]|uniref:hypothetical protein n=1 Tax=Kitasatospora sp. NPDC006697 TaxID=3364020 RepID=UPI003699E28C